MSKPLILLAFLAPALCAQSPAELARRQQGQQQWISAPGVNTVVHNLRPEGQTGPVLGHPFSATEVRQTRQTLADGTHVNHSDTSAFYRDAQGRMRTQSPERVIVYDPVARFTYTLDPAHKVYEKHAIDAQTGSTSIAVIGDSTWIKSGADPGPHQPVEQAPAHDAASRYHAEAVASPVVEELPPQTVNGIAARGSRITITIPTGTFGNDRDVKVVNERWYSDELQVLVKTINSDPRFGVTTYDLINVVQGAPDPGLFHVPVDYRLPEAGHHE
jgi:hypothetical protein